HFEECLKLQGGDRDGKITLLHRALLRNNLGYMYERTGLYGRAREEYDQCLKLIEGVKNAELDRANCLRNRGWVQVRVAKEEQRKGKEDQRRGNGQAAAECFRRSRDSFDGASQDLDVARRVISEARASGSVPAVRRNYLNYIAAETASQRGLLSLLLEKYG